RPPPRETVARQPARRSPVLDADVVANRDEAATDRRYVGHPDLLVVVETRAFSRRGLPRGAVDRSPDERLALVEIRADRDHAATGCRRESRRDRTGELRAVDPPPAAAVVRNPGDRAGPALSGAELADRDDTTADRDQVGDLGAGERRSVRDCLPAGAVTGRPDTSPPGTQL